MTKKRRRDKESSAQGHQTKIKEKGSPIASLPVVMRFFGRGIVNLACLPLQGKVAKKARIRLGPLRLSEAPQHMQLRKTGFHELSAVW